MLKAFFWRISRKYGPKLKFGTWSSIWIKILSKTLLQIISIGAAVVEFYSKLCLGHQFGLAQPLMTFRRLRNGCNTCGKGSASQIVTPGFHIEHFYKLSTTTYRSWLSNFPISTPFPSENYWIHCCKLFPSSNLQVNAQITRGNPYTRRA